jgi:hypothetical protein
MKRGSSGFCGLPSSRQKKDAKMGHGAFVSFWSNTAIADRDECNDFS